VGNAADPCAIRTERVHNTYGRLMNRSLWEILNMSGYALWVIVAFSVLSVAVAVERLVVQWRFMERARNLHETVARCLNRGALDEARSACERSKSPLADVYLVGYQRLGRGKKEHLAAAVNRERLRVMTDLKSRLWMLGTVGATAPFVGLFGTVFGIMSAMSTMAENKRNDFSLVAGPIAEALYATAAGILVAVEAVIIYNFFNQRLQRTATEFKMLSDEFLEMLEELPPETGKGSRRSDEDDKSKDKEKGDGAREAA
jgi:biopolymer transport protein ExbB